MYYQCNTSIFFVNYPFFNRTLYTVHADMYHFLQNFMHSYPSMIFTGVLHRKFILHDAWRDKKRLNVNYKHSTTLTQMHSV